MTRLDCVTGSASGMRAALVQAMHHSRHRSAFGGRWPTSRSCATCWPTWPSSPRRRPCWRCGWPGRSTGAYAGRPSGVQRLAIAVGKFWVCKRQPAVVGEALECLGGNGYVEESGLPRLYRDAPLNSIWEGSGNVQALDALRALRREPDSLDAFLAEVGAAAGADRAAGRGRRRR